MMDMHHPSQTLPEGERFKKESSHTIGTVRLLSHINYHKVSPFGEI